MTESKFWLLLKFYVQTKKNVNKFQFKLVFDVYKFDMRQVSFR